MNQRRQTEIAFEIVRVFVFGNNWRDHAAWCSECESYVPMISIFTAAVLDKTSVAEIFGRVETGELHYQVAVEGALLLCFSSLLNTGREIDGENPAYDLPESAPTRADLLIR